MRLALAFMFFLLISSGFKQAIGADSLFKFKLPTFEEFKMEKTVRENSKGTSVIIKDQLTGDVTEILWQKDQTRIVVEYNPAGLVKHTTIYGIGVITEIDLTATPSTKVVTILI